MTEHQIDWISRFYQEFLAKSLTDKYTNLNLQMDKVIHNANSELSTLHSKLSGLLQFPVRETKNRANGSLI